ncbi:DDE transposase, partial [Streptococcus sp. HF-1907]|nr:DDE transposase [Streptococcus sp. HF-1907]
HPKYNNSKSYRLKRSVEPIIVTIVARSSAKFKRLYKERTSIEKLNGDWIGIFVWKITPLGALAKMKVVVTMSFLVMVGFALYKLNHGQMSQLASWVV